MLLQVSESLSTWETQHLEEAPAEKDTENPASAENWFSAHASAAALEVVASAPRTDCCFSFTDTGTVLKSLSLTEQLRWGFNTWTSHGTINFIKFRQLLGR